MNAKILRNLISLAVACLIAIPGTAIADEPSGPSTPIVLMPKNKNDRPKAPSLQSISCWYDGEHLTIDFADPEGWCDITVVDEDDASAVSASFDSASPAEVYIGEHANATIYISTESGNEYVGYLTN